jgi:isoleucyl-tRNA synthetase
MLPAKDTSRLDAKVERSMNRLMAIIELVRVMRDRKNYPMKKPIKSVVVIHSNPEYISDVRALSQYFEGEVNALNVTYTSDEGDYVVRKVEANMAALGKRLKKEAGSISAALKKFTPEETAAFLASGTAVVMGQTITMEDVKVTHTFREGIENYATNTDNDVLVLMTTEMDEAMVDMWRAREFVSAVQKLRKKAGLVITDKVQVQLTTEHDEVVQSLTNAAATINATVPEGSWSVSKVAAAAAAAASAAEPLIESDADAEVGALAVKIQLFRA